MLPRRPLHENEIGATDEEEAAASSERRVRVVEVVSFSCLPVFSRGG